MTDICFWNKCNNHCLMCSNPDDFWKERDYNYNYLSRRLLSLRGKIKDMTVTGGEPTIHPDFLRIIDLLKRELPKIEITLLSNGRRFFYPLFTKKCLELNNVNIAISLHGYDAQSHDRITQVNGSFQQTVTGIRNILKYKRKGQNLEIRTVITKLTSLYIHKILYFIRANFPMVDRVVLMFMEMEGMADKDIKTTGTTYKERNNYLRRIKSIIKDFKEIRFYHFPLCRIEADLWKYVWRTLPKDEISFPPPCKICWCRRYCLGVHRGYLKRFGDSEFSPPQRLVIKNSNDHHHPIADVIN
jgi:His-Xaa-Ser system radical SAM maturase HxsC